MTRLPCKVFVKNPDGSEEEQDLYPDSKCSICGAEPSAMWGGQEPIFVCRNCALDVLPRLIADALIDDYRNDEHFSKYRQRAKMVFSRSVVAALHDEKH
jgi:hypothetical protein